MDDIIPCPLSISLFKLVGFETVWYAVYGLLPSIASSALGV